ncbi:translation initiation factor IF-3 [Eurosta solidaginis]|uniref:translation initiation factor IF-3 n=1 Tax=Eurosta solidaginis TaxID=178769 RepID=UPI003531324A
MNLLLQRASRTVLYSILQNSGLVSACARSKTTDVWDTSSPQVPTSKGGATRIAQFPKITLIQPNQSITVVTLKEAQKMAKRRELRLVKQQDFDTKTQRPVYRLVTAAEMLSEDVDESARDNKKSAEKKSEKSLSIGCRISDHDLSSRLKHISKWLAKNHHVSVLIQGNPDEMGKCDRITKTIEQSIREPAVIGRIMQKRVKGSHIKFNIVPAQQEEQNETESNQQT